MSVKGWFIVAHSAALGHKPVRRTLCDTPLVLFRSAGQAVALLDRCAHRNVPLSLGCVVDGQIQCAYHGWRYDAAGVCQQVPALLSTEASKARQVQSFLVHEGQGYIWVGLQDPGPPPVLRPATLRYDGRFAASLFATAENILDVPHTAFLHRGWFRGVGAPTRVTVVVRRQLHGVEAEYIGEAPPRGLVGRWLAPGGGVVKHIDRFALPSTAVVEYSLGPHALQISNFLTPVTAHETHVYTHVDLQGPRWLQWAARALVPFGKQIGRQDARMLAAQTRTLQHFGGEQFVYTDADVLGPHIARLLKLGEQQVGEHQVEIQI